MKTMPSKMPKWTQIGLIYIQNRQNLNFGNKIVLLVQEFDVASLNLDLS